MTTDPIVESVWVVPGADGTGQVQSSEARDEVWMIVKRTINGSTKRYVEVLERDFEHGHDQEDAYYADSLITYDQPLTVTGLTVAADVAAAPVHFDAFTELDGPAALTGVADSPNLLFSAWLNPTNANTWDGFAFTYNLFEGSDGGANSFALQIAANGGAPTTVQVALIFFSPGGNFFSGPTTPVTLTGGWQHFLMAADLNHVLGAKVFQLYIDDVAIPMTVTGETGGALSFPWASGPLFCQFTDSAVAGYGYTGDAYQVWCGAGQFLDLSVTANRRKFISASGQVVDVGSDGSTPTGTAPAAFFLGGVSTFETNLGTGGAFTQIGHPLTDATTNPPGV